MRLQIDHVPSAIGEIILVADGKYLVSLDFSDYESRLYTLLGRRYGSFDLVPTRNPIGARVRLNAYLGGDLQAFDGLSVATGGTAFQQRVWHGLREIPPGRTESYGTLAGRLGKPTASRAVGYANSLNPIAIVLPCHRVIGANRALTGYAGGLERKRWLLRHEGVVLE